MHEEDRNHLFLQKRDFKNSNRPNENNLVQLDSSPPEENMFVQLNSENKFLGSLMWKIADFLTFGAFSTKPTQVVEKKKMEKEITNQIIPKEK